MWECWGTFTFYGFQIWDWVHCLIIDLIYRMMHEGCGPMLLLQWVVTNDLIYIWYIGLPPAIRCVWLLGSKIRWTDLFWLESRELCWQIAALREDSHWHYNIDIVVTPGDIGCQATRQSNADTSPSDWDKYQQWVDRNSHLCRGDTRKQSRQTPRTGGTVCNAISESGSQEILHWPLFQGE